MQRWQGSLELLALEFPAWRSPTAELDLYHILHNLNKHTQQQKIYEHTRDST